jgi:hypothetical protein
MPNSQETRLLDSYDRDPTATQRLQFSIMSGRTISTAAEVDYERDSPSQYHQCLELLGIIML